jgi:hypothetical protein
MEWESAKYSPYELGGEGIWHRTEDGDIIKLEPFENTEFCWNYEISVKPVRQNSLTEYRYLVKYWDSDVYMASLSTQRFSVIGHGGDGNTYWEYSSRNVSLGGIYVIEKQHE